MLADSKLKMQCLYVGGPQLRVRLGETSTYRTMSVNGDSNIQTDGYFSVVHNLTEL